MISSEYFGVTPSGEEVRRYCLRNGALTANILNLGGIVQDLRLDGWPYPLVLGSPDVAPYFGTARYFGAVIGRCANRVAGGRFMLEGQEFSLERNDRGMHCLHGGSKGCDTQIWQVDALTESSIELSITLPDAHMGFPGTMQVQLRISLTAGSAIVFDFRAQTDRPTPCNFAHHGYFNLDGTPDISEHLLKIDAPSYLPTDETGIPHNDPYPVTGTPFDFRHAKPIGHHRIDHNFCLSHTQKPCRSVATLTSPRSGITLTVETTEPGLQIYDAAHIPASGLPGLMQEPYGPRAGLALETQCWPDAPNRPDFPNALLQPGETYHHTVKYVFISDTQNTGKPGF